MAGSLPNYGQLAPSGRHATFRADETAAPSDPQRTRVAKLTTGTGQNTATMVQDRAPLTQKGPASHRAGFLIRLRQEAYFAFGNLVEA